MKGEMIMQDYKEIVKQIKKNANKAHELEALNKKMWHDRNKGDEYAHNTERIEELYLINKILTDNARQSAIATILPVFAELINKYAGKPYGEKTKQKIAEEMKKLTGFRVYLYAGEYRQEIRFYDGDSNFFGYTNTELALYAWHHRQILHDNKIVPFCVEDWSLSYCAEYVDDVINRLCDIKQARQTAMIAYEKAEQAFRELNELVPSSIDHVYPNTFRGYF